MRINKLLYRKYRSAGLVLLCLLLAGKTYSQASQQKNIAPVINTADSVSIISGDIVPMPFMAVKKRNLTGGYNVIYNNQLRSYPSTDIRNAFTGIAIGLEVLELNGSPGVVSTEGVSDNITEKITLLSRGRNVRYIVDDMPVNITELSLDPDEIESVTLVKDIVGKAMYGPIAGDGIIYIKTRRGRANQKHLDINMETGLSSIDRMPEWVSGADYARLNNQAYENSGLAPRFSQIAIASYSENDPYNMYFPSVNFSDMLLKNSMLYNRANISSSGGTEEAQYSTYLGYSGEGDIYNIGPKAGYDRINARSNVDLRVNKFIKLQFDLFGGVSIRKSPNYSSGLDGIEFNSIINDITSIPPIEFPVYANNNSELESPWYAVTSNYNTNPVAELSENGYYTETGRQVSSNFALNYDMSQLLNGLSSRSFFGFNIHNLIRLGKEEGYTAYTVNPAVTPGGADTILLSFVRDGEDQSDEALLDKHYSQRFTIYESLNYEKDFGRSHVQSSLTYFLYKETVRGVQEPRRSQNVILTGLYSFNNKYNIQGVLNYSGTYSFNKDNRSKFFPSIGASWVMSEEAFLSGIPVIDFLKLRAEIGTIGYESFFSPYYYRDDYNSNSSGSQFGPNSANQWFGSSLDNSVYRTTPGRLGNPALSWEERKEISVGIDALLFNKKISLEATYYNNLRNGIISQLSNIVPSISGSGVLPYFNHNTIRYYGLETGLQYTNNAGRFVYSIGGNATTQNSEVIKYDEPAYRVNYRSRINNPVDSYFGLKYLGKLSASEASEVDQVYDETLNEGDLKYADMNGDNVIDENDKTIVGHTTPRLLYSLNARFAYRNFEVIIIGTGRALYDIPLNNKYYWNGWGDDVYSKFVMDNAGESYPNLTYYKVNNNFIASDFWLTKGGFFKIQNAELAYNVPVSKLNMDMLKGIRLFARGANLFTFTKVKDIDPESRDSGIEVYPLFTTMSGGIKLTF